MNNNSRNKIPKWIWILFIIAFPGSILFALEMIYEMTYLTWIRGPQMIGFSLMHVHTLLYIFFILSLFTLFLWIIIVIPWSLKHRKTTWFSKYFKLAFSASIINLLLISLPEGFYQRNTIRLLGNSIHNNELYSYSAAVWDIKSVKFYLKRGIDVNKQDKDGRTALMGASVGNQKEIIELLIEKGADINISDRSGSTALTDAAAEGNFEIVRLLIDKGADINDGKSFGSNALNEAVRDGQIEIARMLINKGADINSLNNILRYDSAYYTTDNEDYKKNIPEMKKRDSTINVLLKEYKKK